MRTGRERMRTFHSHGLGVSKRSGMQEHAGKLRVCVRAELVRFALHEKEERLQRGHVVGTLRERRVHQSTVGRWLHVHLQSGQLHRCTVARTDDCSILCSYCIVGIFVFRLRAGLPRTKGKDRRARKTWTSARKTSTRARQIHLSSAGTPEGRSLAETVPRVKYISLNNIQYKLN